MKVSVYITFFFTLVLFSCSGNKIERIITCQVHKSDYKENIFVPGTVQAVSSVPVMYDASFGQMTVVRIAQDGAYVRKGDTLCILSSSSLESNYDGQLASIESLEADLERTKANYQLSIALLKAQLASNQAQLKISYLDSLRLKYVSGSEKKLIELGVRKALIEEKKAGRKLAATKAISESEIAKKKAIISQEKERIQKTLDQLRSNVIIAQRDGVVIRGEAPRIIVSSGSSIGTFGGPIREGTVLFAISSPLLQFPDLSRMQVSADVAEADFRKIERGQKVVITVPAADHLATTGRVNRKSLARSAAQRYSASPVKLYEVIIDVDSCHSDMKPGLSADCEIITREVKDTVFVPSIAVFEKDSTKIVYVKNRKKFLPVKVETGVSGSNYTIVAGGLKGNEIISLSEPPMSLVMQTNARRPETSDENLK